MKKLFAVLLGIFIFAGIPLLAWLPAGVLSFAAQPARLAYLMLAAIVQLAVVAWVPGQGFSQGAGRDLVKRQRLVVILLQLLTLAILIVSPWTDRRQILPLPEVFRYAGVTFYAVGAFLMNWSIVWLGRHFSVDVTIQENHQLITDGPYKLVRHPRYTGIMVCFLGIALVFASAVGALLALLLITTLLWRVHDEEAFMARQFPTEWPAYCRKTARLIPKVL